VRATPGSLQQGGASFAATHWSVIAQSALTDVPEAANALAQLCEMYWPPIYSFIRRRGYSPADAQDLTQSFFAFFFANQSLRANGSTSRKVPIVSSRVGEKFPFT
jgi:RNA polymerase sigma-70 factor (ECF subfamily)